MDLPPPTARRSPLPGKIADKPHVGTAMTVPPLHLYFVSAECFAKTATTVIANEVTQRISSSETAALPLNLIRSILFRRNHVPAELKTCEVVKIPSPMPLSAAL